MTDSILIHTKKLLGLTEDDHSFDMDVILHINSAFQRLNQLGVGPSEIFMIEDSTATWSDFFGDDDILPSVPIYVYYKTRVGWDPPTGGALDSMNREIERMEWLLNVTVDPSKSEKEAMNLGPLWG